MNKLPFNPFYLWIEKRIKRNRNAIIVINGPTGSGKTYSAIRLAMDIAKLLGSNFEVKNNLDFSFKGLINKMELPENQKPGTPFVFEEVGAVGGGAASREWQSKENKLFFSWLQTSRHQNQIFIMTCPCFDNLELGARKLVHWQMNTSGIDYTHCVAFLKPYQVQINSRTGKFYFKYLRTRYKGKRTKFIILEARHIGKKVADQYETMKLEFSAKLKEKIMKDDDKKPLTERQEQVFNLLKQNFKIEEISSQLDCNIPNIYHHLKIIRKKGYEI